MWLVGECGNILRIVRATAQERVEKDGSLSEYDVFPYAKTRFLGELHRGGDKQRRWKKNQQKVHMGAENLMSARNCFGS